jgi:HSP20 family protein
MFGNLSSFEGSLFDELRRMDMDHMFGAGPWPNGIRAVARGTYPPINIGSTPEQVDVYLFAAGIDPKSLDISIQRNLLTIDGERRLTAEQGANYFRSERFSGGFHRVITLPDDVDPEAVEAKYQDGILRITIQRHEAAKPRQIKVK